MWRYYWEGSFNVDVNICEKSSWSFQNYCFWRDKIHLVLLQIGATPPSLTKRQYIHQSEPLTNSHTSNTPTSISNCIDSVVCTVWTTPNREADLVKSSFSSAFFAWRSIVTLDSRCVHEERWLVNSEREDFRRAGVVVPPAGGGVIKPAKLPAPDSNEWNWFGGFRISLLPTGCLLLVLLVQIFFYFSSVLVYVTFRWRFIFYFVCFDFRSQKVVKTGWPLQSRVATVCEGRFRWIRDVVEIRISSRLLSLHKKIPTQHRRYVKKLRNKKLGVTKPFSFNPLMKLNTSLWFCVDLLTWTKNIENNLKNPF